MNWAKANVLMALIEGKGVKPHLPAPLGCGHGCVTGNTGLLWQEPRPRMLGDVPLLGSESSVAGCAPERTRGKGTPGPGTKGLPQRSKLPPSVR